MQSENCMFNVECFSSLFGFQAVTQTLALSFSNLLCKQDLWCFVLELNTFMPVQWTLTKCQNHKSKTEIVTVFHNFLLIETFCSGHKCQAKIMPKIWFLSSEKEVAVFRVCIWFQQKHFILAFCWRLFDRSVNSAHVGFLWAWGCQFWWLFFRLKVVWTTTTTKLSYIFLLSLQVNSVFARLAFLWSCHCFL